MTELKQPDMKHLDHLEAVATSDVSILRYKEDTYQGSWKAAGGRSAWFMMRRNLDRLLVMMQPPKVILALFEGQQLARYEIDGLNSLLRAEDLFMMIEAQPSGADGTVLAVLRDLRRYATLVEAEMIARGVVAVEQVPRRTAKEPALAAPYGLKGGTHVDLRHPASLHDFIHGMTRCAGCDRVISNYLTCWFEAGKFYHQEHKPGAEEPSFPPQPPTPEAPEAGNQHSTLTPWGVSIQWRINHGYQGEPHSMCMGIFERWWGPRERGLWVLRPFVKYDEQGTGEHLVPSEVRGLYTRSTYGWLLNIQDCPPEIRESRNWFPHMRLELNHKERQDLPEEWQRDLYVWHEGEGKYKLPPEHQAWHLPGGES